MKFLLFILILFQNNIWAQINSDHLINQFQNSIKQTGTPPKIQNCLQCGGEQNVTYPTEILVSETNKKNIQISVIDLNTADKLVQDFQAMKNIPFDYALDGCFARAEKMAVLLEQKNIITGKAFVLGRLFASTKYGPVNWRYHVAPVVYVKIADKIIPYIIDPSLSDKAMPYEDWKNLISNGGRPPNPRMPVRVISYFTNRFAYDPKDVNSELVEYNPADLADMDATLARLLEIRNQLDSKK